MPSPYGAPDYSGIDFAQYFKMWGLPADVQARVAQIFQTTGDVNVASQLAMAYIRGTDWYGQTYPGIQIAEAKGLVNDEQGYRALLNQQTQMYQQYLGRDISTDEFTANLNEGVNNNTIAGRLQGVADAQAMGGGDWNSLPGYQEGIRRGIVGDQAGYFANANAQNQLYQKYLGRDITPAEYSANLTEGIDNTTLDQRLEWMANPGLQTAEQKGLVSSLAGFRQMTNQQTQLYQQYYGRAPTQDELTANINAGTTTQVLGQRFQGAAITSAKAAPSSGTASQPKNPREPTTISQLDGPTRADAAGPRMSLVDISGA